MTASMSLTLKDGRTVLMIEPMEIESKAEAKTVAATIEKWAESLPDNKPRQPRKSSKKTPSRQTATRRKEKNGEVDPAQTSLLQG